jgi:hypothetical protein
VQFLTTSLYEKYCSAYALAVCRYEYVDRNNVLYIFTFILALYDGLIVSLRFFVWNILQIYIVFTLITRLFNRRRPSSE